MEMNDRISVIVPVYNVAAYLPQCLDSILSQDHADLEVLLIDDGSTDGSGGICDAYARRDSRIRVLHQANAGAAAAKNAGLRAATGEYLSFVDSDDFLEPAVYGYMLAVLKEQDADAAQFAFRDVYRSGAQEHPMPPGRTVTDCQSYLARFTQDWRCALLWNKLYKRALFRQVFFEEGHKIDDEYFTYQGFLKPGKVVCDDRVIYNYRRRASSVMRSAQSQAQLTMDRIDALAKRRERVIRQVPQLRETFDVQFLDALVYMSEYPDNTPESLALLKTQLRAYLRQPGNTRPPRHLWRGLCRLGLCSTRTLLARCGVQQTDADIADCFP